LHQKKSPIDSVDLSIELGCLIDKIVKLNPSQVLRGDLTAFVAQLLRRNDDIDKVSLRRIHCLERVRREGCNVLPLLIERIKYIDTVKVMITG